MLAVIVSVHGQLAVAFADSIQDKAAQGQTFGKGLITDPKALYGVDSSNNTYNFKVKGQNQTLTREQMFPGAGSDTFDYKQLYGNPAGADAAMATKKSDMESGTDRTSKSYQDLQQSITSHSHPDLSGETALWGQTKTTIDNIFNNPEFRKMLADCDVQSNYIKTESTKHIPDYQTCTRALSLGTSYSSTHDVNLSVWSVQVYIGSIFVAWFSGAIDLKNNNWWMTSPSDGYQSVPIVTANQTLDYNTLCGDGKALYSQNTDHWDWDYHPSDYYGEDGEWANHVGFDGSYYFHVWESPSCGNGLVANLGLEDDGKKKTYRYGATTVFYLYKIANESWSNVDAVRQAISVINDGFAQGSYGCSEYITNINGVNLSSDQLSASPFPGIPSNCKTVYVNISNMFNTGYMDPWTDPDGNVHYVYNPGDTPNTCGTLQNNPQCKYTRSECVDGATGGSGTCYVYDDIYDCGQDVLVDDISRTETYNCIGAVRCMGSDCVNQTPETNPGFAKAAAMLSAAQDIAHDTDCSGAVQGGTHDEFEDECKIFKGQGYTCKKAVGGVVDCCVEPAGVSLSQYLELLYAGYKMMSAEKWIGGIENPIYGSWQALKEGASSGWSEISKTFTDGWESASAATPTQLVGNDAAKESVGMIGQLTKDVADWTANAFGESARDALFTAVNANGGEATSLSDTAGYEIGGTILGPIMTAYMVYQVTMILIQLIWQCEKAEYELGVKRQLKACHRIGSYCNTSALGVCIESRDSYCCFNSPLSRILQEQIRGQLGIGWGSAKSPSCAPLSIRQLESVNWDAINLDEWVAILVANNRLPTVENINIEKLTGAGSVLNVDGQGRPSTAQRTQEYMNSVGKIDSTREQLRQNMWGQGN